VERLIEKGMGDTCKESQERLGSTWNVNKGCALPEVVFLKRNRDAEKGFTWNKMALTILAKNRRVGNALSTISCFTWNKILCKTLTDVG